MLTNQQEQILAKQLTNLHGQLSKFDPMIAFRDLPKEVQQTCRAIQIIGPITSSGLEHLYQILNRISVAIYRLTSPRYETDGVEFYTIESEAEEVVVEETPASPTVPPPVPTPEPPQTAPPSSTASQSNELSFGPFDPRKGDS